MQPSGAKPRVLLVDDDQGVLDGMARVLWRQFAPVRALGPAECLAIIEKEGPFAVVVADMNMPGMDGLTLLSKIKAAYPGTATILLTGAADLSAAEDAVARGAISGVISKPCPPAVLISSLQAAFEHAQKVVKSSGATHPSDSAPPAEDRLELLDLLFGATSDGIVDWNLSTGATTYNGRFQYLLGWDDGDLPLLPETWKELIHEHDRPLVETRFEEFLEGAWPFDITARMRHRTSGWRWILMRANSRRDEAGRATRVVLVFSDIDQQVRAEAQIRAILEALPDTIVRVRQDGKVLAIKDGSQFKSSRYTVASQPDGLFRTVLESDTGADVLRYVQRGIPKGEVAVVRCQTGRTIDDRSEYEVRLVQSGPDEVECIIRDVTRERRIEDQLARTRGLDAIGRLAAGMAHEINTPLQFIGDNLSFAKRAIPPILDLIVDFRAAMGESSLSDVTRAELDRRAGDLDTPFLREALPAALDSGFDGLEQIGRIVRAMKTFEEVAASNGMADINQLVENATIVTQHTWKPVAQLSLSLTEAAPLVPCVAAEIGQAVVELILNAAYAVAQKQETDGGLGHIGVSTVFDESRGTVTIQVEDDGIGIPEANQHKIFAPFFTTRRQGTSLGQGLYHVHAVVVDGHRGEISFTSREGQGTCFAIRLPLEQGPEGGIAK